METLVPSLGFATFAASGADIDDVHVASQRAIEHARNLSRPALLVVKNVPRRFGHAATDRQIAYMTQAQIQAQADRNPLAVACAMALERGVITESDLVSRFERTQRIVEEAFNQAVNEPKIADLGLDALVATNSQPLTRSSDSFICRDESASLKHPSVKATNPSVPEAMRKHMTRAYDELLTNQKDVIYIGEDVTHGGYYLVTEGLAAKHRGRVVDFPPDETTLVGAGLGLAQAGFVPIVEIPYAKYLDCAADMFAEVAILNWLNNANMNPQPHTRVGMFIRLQGFDRGVFGGNYHTHNILNVLYPGLDVVCYSNGHDYVRGLRFVMSQVRAGRVVMSVDSTDLLNRRHLDEAKADGYYLSVYPELTEDVDKDELTFDTIAIYKHQSGMPGQQARKRVCIISYGNGVGASKQARALLASEAVEVTVVDCPYLSDVPGGLSRFLAESQQSSNESFDHVVFADVCKEASSMPLLGIANALVNRGQLTRATPHTVIGKVKVCNVRSCV